MGPALAVEGAEARRPQPLQQPGAAGFVKGKPRQDRQQLLRRKAERPRLRQPQQFRRREDYPVKKPLGLLRKLGNRLELAPEGGGAGRFPGRVCGERAVDKPAPGLFPFPVELLHRLPPQLV